MSVICALSPNENEIIGTENMRTGRPAMHTGSATKFAPNGVSNIPRTEVQEFINRFNLRVSLGKRHIDGIRAKCLRAEDVKRALDTGYLIGVLRHMVSPDLAPDFSPIETAKRGFFDPAKRPEKKCRSRVVFPATEILNNARLLYFLYLP